MSAEIKDKMYINLIVKEIISELPGEVNLSFPDSRIEFIKTVRNDYPDVNLEALTEIMAQMLNDKERDTLFAQTETEYVAAIIFSEYMLHYRKLVFKNIGGHYPSAPAKAA